MNREYLYCECGKCGTQHGYIEEWFELELARKDFDSEDIVLKAHLDAPRYEKKAETEHLILQVRR